MDRRIILIQDKIRINNKNLMLDKEDESFLLDKDNPYFSVRNKEKRLLVFSILEKIHYGILRNNLLCIIEEKLNTFIGNVFGDIRGIYNYPFNKECFFYIIGEDGKEKWKSLGITYNRSTERGVDAEPNVEMPSITTPEWTTPEWTTTNVISYGEYQTAPEEGTEDSSPTPNPTHPSYSELMNREIERMMGLAHNEERHVRAQQLRQQQRRRVDAETDRVIRESL